MYTVSTEMKGRHEMQASKVLLLHRRMDNEPPPQRVICAAACWQFAFNCFSSHKAVPLSPGDLTVPQSTKSPTTKGLQETGATAVAIWRRLTRS